MKISNIKINHTKLYHNNHYFYWNIVNQNSYHGMWLATLGAGLISNNQFITISSNFFDQTPTGSSSLYQAYSTDAINYNYKTNLLNLYDSNAHGAMYNGGSTVRPVSISVNQNISNSIKYIITFASGGGSVQDITNNRVPNLGVSFYLYSNDGLNWIRNSMPLGNWRRIRNFNGIWVAFSFIYNNSGGALPDNKMAISYDGLNWSLIYLPKSYRLTDIAFDGTNYIITGSETSTPRTVLISNNLTDWTIINLPSSFNTFDMGVSTVFGNNNFISPIRGTYNKIAKSTNGTDWTIITNNFTSGDNFLNIQYVNNKFVIVTDNSSNTGQTYFSYDGINWTKIYNQPGKFYSTAIYGNLLLGLGFNSNNTAYINFS